MAAQTQAPAVGSEGYHPLSIATSHDDAAVPLNAGDQRKAARDARLALAGRVSLVASLLVAASFATWLSGRSKHLRQIPQDRLEIKATWSSDFDSHCGSMDIDVEYVDPHPENGWGINYDHIPTPEMCCSMCQGEKRCNSFTWIKDAGLAGNPSQCWLKSVTKEAANAKSHTGLVSGVPPPTPDLGVVPQGKNGPGGSLFCYSLMVPTSDEPKLLDWQYRHKASIFACDEFAIYSNKEIELMPGSGVITKVVDSDLKCSFGGDSQSALNTWIFIAVWDRMLKDGDYKKHDWIVKVDPDAVFFPDRLGKVLANHEGDGYISNCKYGLHGPIEVFSKRSMEALAEDYRRSADGKAPHRCVAGQHFGNWGEDMFIDQCLGKILNVDSTLDSAIMCESHCNCPAYYWCQNGTDRVSFHPFKTVDAYETCMANAMNLAEPVVYDDSDYQASYLKHDKYQEVVDGGVQHTGDGKEVSCAKKCGAKFNPTLPCQCNGECVAHGSCCHDYRQTCTGASADENTFQEPKKTHFHAPTHAPTTHAPTTEPGPKTNENGAGECEDSFTSKCDEDDKCCAATKWAKEHGVYEHPEWYHDIPSSAPYQDFQMDLYKEGKEDCKMPCSKVSGVKASDIAKAIKNTKPGPAAHTFYMYRAQSGASYALENINTADLAGVLWYLHNEVVRSTPRKYSIDRIKRYKVTVKNTWEFWNVHKRQFGAFLAYDGARCSSPMCKEIYHQYGFIVGCQKVDVSVAKYLAKSQTVWDCTAGSDDCKAGLWYSLPGPCPTMGLQNEDIGATGTHLNTDSAKTPECKARMPGGHCDAANGAPDCTYSYEEAGEIMLDELVGIKDLKDDFGSHMKDYNDFWNASYGRCAAAKNDGELSYDTRCVHRKEYDERTDSGVGMHWWDGIHDEANCTRRMEDVRSLFKSKYPEFEETLPQPACEFDTYYDGEFDWPVNHTHAAHSGWWANRMSA